MRPIVLFSVFLLCVSQAMAQKTAGDIVTIPVVVHVVYNSQSQNISSEQIRSQIAVLNADYRKKNADAVNVPEAFRDLAADSRLEFRLASIDPLGMPTSGITRTATTVGAFGVDEKIKSTETGGATGWNRDQYLNIWVGNLSNGILGYASSPGCTAEKDGVVIRYDVFGTGGQTRPPYHRGRTAVHEIGHWLGLKHIWGDAACGDDAVDDTPPQQGPTRGCPSGVLATCTSGPTGSMYMNFMDFTNDECVNMFTKGQVRKMHELFEPGGARYAMLQSGKAANSELYASEEATGSTALYPNPVNEFVYIDLSGLATVEGLEATIYNHLGQLRVRIPITTRIVKINTSTFAPGLYYTSIGGKTHRFVKVK